LLKFTKYWYKITLVQSMCLSERPTISQAGLSVHGYARNETFLMLDLWSLHFYLYSGALEVQGHTYEITPGRISLAPPNTELTWTFPDRAPHYYVHFHLSAGCADADITQLPVMNEPPGPIERLSEDFELLTGSLPFRRTRAEVMVWELLFRLEVAIRPPEEPDTARPHSKAQIATSLIENGIGGPLSVAEIAERVGVSHNHLTNLFRQAYGLTVVGYIRRRRCERAGYLLRHTSLPVLAVARQVGIHDPHYFNKLIRREFGLSPTAYRSIGIKTKSSATF